MVGYTGSPAPYPPPTPPTRACLTSSCCTPTTCRGQCRISSDPHFPPKPHHPLDTVHVCACGLLLQPSGVTCEDVSGTKCCQSRASVFTGSLTQVNYRGTVRSLLRGQTLRVDNMAWVCRVLDLPVLPPRPEIIYSGEFDDTNSPL
eukprot:1192998-Prorocentrum_minimum.AAC.1